VSVTDFGCEKSLSASAQMKTEKRKRTALATRKHEKQNVLHSPYEQYGNERRKIDPTWRWQSASDWFNQRFSNSVEEAGDGL
jgi:hypothetical protein